MRKSQSELFWGGGSIGSKNFGVLYYFYSVVFVYPFFVIYVDRTKARFHFCQVLKCEPQSEGYSLNMHVFSVSKLAVKPYQLRATRITGGPFIGGKNAPTFVLCQSEEFSFERFVIDVPEISAEVTGHSSFGGCIACAQASSLLKHLRHMQPFI